MEGRALVFSITGFPKWQSPQKNGARVRRAPFCNDSFVALTAVRLLGGNPINIGTSNADIGELTIGEVGKLPLHGFVPLPSLIEAGNRVEHGFARPFPGGLSGHAGISVYI
jgi:hypothetical protein